MITARFPVYIPSKSRAKIATTPRNLDRMGVPYRLVVEEHQARDYADVWGEDKILVLDPQYQRDYETCDDAGDSISKGSGPARNFIWDHAASEGAKFHWCMDDNIMAFYRIHQNRAIPLGDGSGFHAMEEFALRYRNIGLAGPEYKMFVPARLRRAPFLLNRKIYSCLLIRTDVPMRWECRYNEDVDLGLRMLKAGWNVVTFIAFLQDKLATQLMPGGNLEAFYAVEGTLEKSKMLVRRHPDVAEVKHRFNRWHHVVDYSSFANRALLTDPDYKPSGVRYEYREIPQTEKLYSGIAQHRPRAIQDIQLGFHPLLTLTKGRLPNAALHEQADRSGERADPTQPFRCGSCRFRLQFVNGPHQYMYKCGFGQLDDGTYPRAPGRHDAEIRLWWPACKDYEPGQVPLNGWAKQRG